MTKEIEINPFENEPPAQRPPLPFHHGNEPGSPDWRVPLFYQDEATGQRMCAGTPLGSSDWEVWGTVPSGLYPPDIWIASRGGFSIETTVHPHAFGRLMSRLLFGIKWRKA